jgi:cyclopropane fatty-acyl-phospholipid synthase-like methyltransferase
VKNTVSSKGVATDGNGSERAVQYKREFWEKANLSFSEPWYRLEKSAKLITQLAGGRECSLLDIGCGPGTLMRLLPPNIDYHGIDIAIQSPAANLIEADIAESPISFEGKRFDLVTALGLFEYIGAAQSRKFAEIAELLTDDGKFIVTYTNFGHRKKRIYEAFSNIQPLAEFRRDLQHYFSIDRSFPASHNWKHSQPNRKIVKTINVHVNANVPFVSLKLAVDYFFICTRRSGR